MSQLQKLKAKQNKVKVVFNFERTNTGIEITVKSQKLGELIRNFHTHYERFNDPMTLAIMRSLKYSNEYRENTIITGHCINLTIIDDFRFRGKTTKTLKIDNVFTNDEIKKYIELFETYLMKIKQLTLGLNIPSTYEMVR